MANESTYLGLFFVLLGLTVYFFPGWMALVPGRVWERNPEKAKEKQKVRAALRGFACVAIGLLFIAWGLSQ